MKYFPHWPIDFDNFDKYDLNDFIKYQDDICESGQYIPKHGPAYITTHIRKQAYQMFPEYRGYQFAIVLFINTYKEQLINAYNEKNIKNTFDILLNTLDPDQVAMMVSIG